MMIVLKLLAPILVLVAALLQVGLESLWRDRRTRKHKVVLRGLVGLIVLGTAVTCWTVVADNRESARSLQLLTELRASADQESERAAQRERDAVQRTVGLESQLADLRESFDPFMKLAMSRYPAAHPDEALRKLRDDIERVQTRTAVLERAASPRVLSTAQLDSVVTRLKSFGPAAVGIRVGFGDQEAVHLANQVEQALKAAGWTVSEHLHQLFEKPVFGEYILVGTNPPPDKALVLYHALRAAGLEVVVDVDPKRVPDTTSLVIGAKRPIEGKQE